MNTRILIKDFLFLISCLYQSQEIDIDTKNRLSAGVKSGLKTNDFPKNLIEEFKDLSYSSRFSDNIEKLISRYYREKEEEIC